MNKTYKLFIFSILFIILIANSVCAAKVYGSIYDHDLNTIKQTVVEINSTPKQRHISKFGGYSFELQPGNYKITATYTQNNIALEIAEEHVQVTSKEGEYIVDLFSYKNISIEPLIANNTNERKINSVLLIQVFLGLTIFAVIILLIYASITFFKIKSKKKIKPVHYNIQYHHEADDTKVDHQTTTTPTEETKKEHKQINIITADEDAPLKKRILKLIKENDNQITQKEIRKKIDLSQSKISQVITDLTKENKIEKIKKGRSNILILKQ